MAFARIEAGRMLGYHEAGGVAGDSLQGRRVFILHWIGRVQKDDVREMLARQLGASVAPHPEGRTQIGYYPIRPTAAGLTLCPNWPGQVYHWHREGFELPAGAELLAAGDDFPVQAFRSGHAFGFQFHPDVTYAMMHCWTTRGRMDLPGARPRHLHFADRAVHDATERAWLSGFIDGWLKRMPASIMSEAAE